MLELRDVHVYYGAIHAIQGISLRVEEGEIVTLIGGQWGGKIYDFKYHMRLKQGAKRQCNV